MYGNVKPEILVARGIAIKAQTKALNAELAEIAALLIAAGAGDYTDGDGGKCTVVQPKPKFAPDGDAIDQTRELLGDDVFKKLFVRSVIYTASKSVRHVAAALLTPAKLAKLNALCEVASTPFVIWPK